LPQCGKSDALAIKILLVTAVRKMELVRARWEHIDLEAATVRSIAPL
jgi:integrase